MKNSLIVLLTVLMGLSFYSCKDDLLTCNETNTGTIEIINDDIFFTTDPVDFYLDDELIATLADNESLSNDGIVIGSYNLYAIRGVDTFYFWPITISICETTTHRTSDATAASDQRLKNKIEPINNAMASIQQLIPYSYEYQKVEGYTGYLPEGLHYGYLAQDVLNVYPSFVEQDGNGFYSIRYGEMIPILTKGMQEQQQEIDDLKMEIQQLKELVTTMQLTAGQ